VRFECAVFVQAMEELSEQIEIENPPPELGPNGKPLPDKEISTEFAYQHFACLYIRYLQIFRKLENCYDQIVHPQKRRDIKKVLEVVMARTIQVFRQVLHAIHLTVSGQTRACAIRSAWTVERIRQFG